MKFIKGFKSMGFLDVTIKHQRSCITFYALLLMFHLFLVALLQVLGPESIHSPSKDSHMCSSSKQHPQSLDRTPEQKEKLTHQGDNCHVQ